MDKDPENAVLTSCPDAPAVEIAEYKTPFGYLIYRVQNNDEGQAYEERATFDAFTNVQLLAPHQGNTFTLLAEPQQTAVVLMKLGCNGYNLSKSFCQKLIKNDDGLIDECIDEGEQEERGKGIMSYIH